jgi:RNA polymerase sigma-70 factor (ECF subfamily)
VKEEQIIAGLKAKDRITTEYLYDTYSKALFGVICRIISNRETAEEVFHDSFLNITRKIQSDVVCKGHLYTWMANICRKCANDKNST